MGRTVLEPVWRIFAVANKLRNALEGHGGRRTVGTQVAGTGECLWLRVSLGTLGKNMGTTYHWSVSSSIWTGTGVLMLVVFDTTLVKKKKRKKILG